MMFIDHYLSDKRNLLFRITFEKRFSFVLIMFVYYSISLFALTTTVPLNYTTIQEAIDYVQNDADPGEVIINSNATYDEYLRISQSVTLRGGDK